MHRDVSSGNVLIRPIFLAGDDGTIRVEWIGILSDWELSKPIVPAGTSTARQPERTVSKYYSGTLGPSTLTVNLQGTFRYMSAASLTDIFHVVEVADEIESFINVLLHNALEHLPHNFDSGDMKTVMKYFTGSTNENGLRTCGAEKRAAVRAGTSLAVGGKRVRFGVLLRPNKPLNRLLDRLFWWFGARYAVLDYLEESGTQTIAGDTQASGSGEEPEATRPSQRPRVGEEEEELRPETGPGIAPQSLKEDVQEPSDETKATAALLSTHAAALYVFNDLLDQKNAWPRNEVLRKASDSTVARGAFSDGQSTDHQPAKISAFDANTNSLIATKDVPVIKPARQPRRKPAPRPVDRSQSLLSEDIESVWSEHEQSTDTSLNGD